MRHKINHIRSGRQAFSMLHPLSGDMVNRNQYYFLKLASYLVLPLLQANNKFT
jgi:hypothetical protein